MFGLDPCPWDIGQFGDNVIVLEVVNEGALSVYKLAVHLPKQLIDYYKYRSNQEGVF